MANATRPACYAPTEAEERKLLGGLGFVGPAQAAFCTSLSNPIQKVRDELHRVYPAAMAALDARIMAPVAAAPRAVAPAVARASNAQPIGGEDPKELAARRELLDKKMGCGPWAPDARRTTAYDPRTCTQVFGVGRAS